MHRVAALYDIHGNLPALDAVLEEVRAARVDAVVVGGDVFPGPMASEALARLRSIPAPVHFISGNCERVLLEQLAGTAHPTLPAQARESIGWCGAQLAAEDRSFVASWPLTVQLAVDGIGPVLFCHATARDDDEIFTSRTPEDRVSRAFDGVAAALVVCGHTHMQFDRRVGGLRIVNAGSVGMPFGDPVADWLLLGPDVELRQTPYDLRAAAARVRATSYPQAEEFAARDILAPRSAAEMLELFARAELR